ncbi:hypothetical protein PG994_011021 [Apiospora phragmitis]|uniref:WSC domain-containing protein n=1 Tax=Apiospora phragmitis TaxID=2905665 RepID=A0ABR1TRL7_9PEZI
MFPDTFDPSTCFILEDPATPPSPVQAGIPTNCNRWKGGRKCTSHYSRRHDITGRFKASLNADYFHCGGETGNDIARRNAVYFHSGGETGNNVARRNAVWPLCISKPASAATTATTATTAGGVASPESATYLGCASEAPGRALNQRATAGADMTIEKCLAFCAGAGLPLAGLEYGSECFCGTSLAPPSALGSPEACRMACPGNKKQVCGGPSLLSIFRNSSIVVQSPPVAATPVVATAPQKVAGSSGGVFEYQGCYDEAKGRLLPDAMFDNTTLTVEKCVAFCEGKGFGLAGVEYGRECWCRKTLRQDAAKLDQGRCGMPCKGNDSQLCGGPSAIGIYRKGGEKERDVSQEGEAVVAIEERGKRDGGDDDGEDDNTSRGPEVETPPPQTVVKTVRLVRRGRWGGRCRHA